MDWLRRIWKTQAAAAPVYPAARVAVAVVMTALTMDMLMGAGQTPLLIVAAVILIVALAIPASAAPLPWTYPVLPATLMLACGCTALVPMAAHDH